MITGQLVEPPRSAMKARKEKNTQYVKFYESLMEQ